MRLNTAAEIVGDGRDPRTHRVSIGDLVELTRVWREIRKGETKAAARRLETFLDSVDVRWRGW